MRAPLRVSAQSDEWQRLAIDPSSGVQRIANSQTVSIYTATRHAYYVKDPLFRFIDLMMFL